MRIFAIDPGLGGGWAAVIDGRPHSVGDMPVSGDGARRRIIASALADRMRAWEPQLCVVEMVSAMPGQGVSSMFRFGMAYGAALAIAGTLGIALELVTPPVWKKHFRLTGMAPEIAKEAARQRALELAPWLTANLDRKRDHNRAEALLIGLYGEATWGAAS